MDYIISSGRTEYSILLPENPSTELSLAADELAKCVKQGTGAELKVLKGTARNKAISIGNTPLFTKYQAQFEMGKINLRGFYIRTVDENIIVCGRTDIGVLFGVYELLEVLFGVKVYAGDEVYVPAREEVAFRALDICSQPAIEYRQLSFKSVRQSRLHAHRMRVEVGTTEPDGMYWKYWAEMWVHTMISKLLIPETNADGSLVHPDWYSATRSQVCMTNEEARKALVEKLKEHILKNPDIRAACVGIEDNNGYCTCPRCVEAHAKYGIGGVNIRFVNAVARDIEEWRKQVLPDKDFKIGLVAYVRTKNPPVKWNEEAKKYEPLDPSFMLEPNILVLNCIIDACGLHEIDAPCNHDIADRFEKWKALGAKTFSMWDYHTYYDDNFLYMPGIRSYASYMKKYVENNTGHLFCEGHGQVINPGFHDLKVYMLSKLSWDPSLDTEALLDDFFPHYYHEAGTVMRGYFERLEKHYHDLETEYDELGERGYHVSYDKLGHPEVISERHWPKALLEELKGMLQDAISAVETEQDEELREKLIRRIKREQLMVDYLYIELYTLYCSEEKMWAKIEDFRQLCQELNITTMNYWAIPGENDNLKDVFMRWSCRYPARKIGG